MQFWQRQLANEVSTRSTGGVTATKLPLRNTCRFMLKSAEI